MYQKMLLPNLILEMGSKTEGNVRTGSRVESNGLKSEGFRVLSAKTKIYKDEILVGGAHMFEITQAKAKYTLSI